MKIKRGYIFFILVIMSCALFSQRAFSEDKSKGFYAGPLSDTQKNLQKKADLKKIEESLPAEEAILVDESPILKKERFSFKSWLRKFLH